MHVPPLFFDERMSFKKKHFGHDCLEMVRRDLRMDVIANTEGKREGGKWLPI